MNHAIRPKRHHLRSPHSHPMQFHEIHWLLKQDSAPSEALINLTNLLTSYPVWKVLPLKHQVALTRIKSRISEWSPEQIKMLLSTSFRIVRVHRKSKDNFSSCTGFMGGVTVTPPSTNLAKDGMIFIFS